MNISDLKPQKGSRRKEKRIGRGIGSGHGKTSTKGHKGSLSRSGGGKPPGFEGGQMPIIRRIPKRGFKPYRQTKPEVVNIGTLDRLNAANPITPELLEEAGFVRRGGKEIKILGQGEVKKSFKIQAHYFSRSALEKIKKAGGQATVIRRSKGPELQKASAES